MKGCVSGHYEFFGHDKILKLVFNYRDGDIGAHHIAHRASDAVFGVFHRSGEISFFADGFGFAQTFFRASVDAQVTGFALVGVHFYSWHNSPVGPGVLPEKPIHKVYFFCAQLRNNKISFCTIQIYGSSN